MKTPHRKDRTRKHVAANVRVFFRRLFSLATQPVFLILTFIGNSLVATGAIALYHTEHGVNPAIDSYLDTVWWAVATVTTVGYGDVSPITPAGKVIGIILMVLGTAMFWTYTALFASALITEEITEVEIEIRNVEQSLRRIIGHELERDDLETAIERLEVSLSLLRKRQSTDQV